MNPTMPAQLIDGVQLSQQLRAEIAGRAAKLSAAGQQPGLAVILVGEDPASQVYVRNKVKACGDVGFHSVLEQYDADLLESALLARIAALNADPAIHGILVQMPLPRHINPGKVSKPFRRARMSTATRCCRPANWSPTCRASAPARRMAA